MKAAFWLMLSLGVFVVLFCAGAFVTGNGSLTYAFSGAACVINTVSLWRMRPGDPLPLRWYWRWRERRREAFHGYSTAGLKPNTAPVEQRAEMPAATIKPYPYPICTSVSVTLAHLASDDAPRKRKP